MFVALIGSFVVQLYAVTNSGLIVALTVSLSTTVLLLIVLGTCTRSMLLAAIWLVFMFMFMFASAVAARGAIAHVVAITLAARLSRSDCRFFVELLGGMAITYRRDRFRGSCFLVVWVCWFGSVRDWMGREGTVMLMSKPCWDMGCTIVEGGVFGWCWGLISNHFVLIVACLFGKVVVVVGDCWIMWVELDDMVMWVVNGILVVGVWLGDVVGLWVYNVFEMLVVFYGLARVGVVVLLFSLWLVGEELLW